MSVGKATWILLLTLAMAACNRSYDDSTGTGTGTGTGATQRTQASNGVTYRLVEQKVLQPVCGNCHGGSNQRGGFNFTDLQSVIDGGFIQPGDSANSPLCEVLKSGQMPPNGSKLSSSTVNAICAWIDNGANP